MLIKNFNKKLIRKIEIIKSEQKKKLVFAMITNNMHFFCLNDLRRNETLFLILTKGLKIQKQFIKKPNQTKNKSLTKV